MGSCRSREQHERPASKGEKPLVYKPLPPYWSSKVHGEPGAHVDAPPPELHTEVSLTGIKRSLSMLRHSLSSIPWADGKPVDDPERRIRCAGRTSPTARLASAEIVSQLRVRMWLGAFAGD